MYVETGILDRKNRGCRQLILNKEEIIALNKKSFRKMKFKVFEEWLYDLETYPETILLVLLKEFIE